MYLDNIKVSKNWREDERNTMKFVIKHMNYILKDINLDIKRYSYNKQAENSKEYTNFKFNNDIFKGYDGIKTDFKKLEIISFLFKIIYDYDKNKFYIVSPYPKELFINYLSEELKEIRKFIFNKIYWFLKIEYDGFYYEFFIEKTINSTFKLENYNTLKILNFYSNYKQQNKIFYSLATSIEKEKIKYLKYNINNLKNTYKTINKDDYAKGYEIFISSDDLDENICKPRKSFYEYHYNILSSKMNDWSEQRYCHIIPYSIECHIKKFIDYNLIRSSHEMNMKMRTIERIIENLWKNKDTFELKVSVYIIKHSKLLIQYHLYVPSLNNDIPLLLYTCTDDRATYKYSENPITLTPD